MPIDKSAVHSRGHAIEARVYAEDPGAGYLPGAGPLLRFSPPSLPWVRHDVGVYQGFEVPVFYDSLLAKIAVYGEDRGQAIRRLRDTLDAYVVSGVPTNLQMLRVIAQDPDFNAGAIDTEYVGRQIEPVLIPSDELPVQALASAIAHELVSSGLAGYESGEEVPEAGDVWRRPGPWRMGRLDMSYAFTHAGSGVSATVTNKPGSTAWAVHTLDHDFELVLSPTPGGGTQATIEEETWAVEVTPTDGGLLVQYANADYLLSRSNQVYTGQAGGLAAGPGSETGIKAPLPGVVAKVRVQEGDEVTAAPDSRCSGGHEDGAPDHRSLRRRRSENLLRGRDAGDQGRRASGDGTCRLLVHHKSAAVHVYGLSVNPRGGFRAQVRHELAHLFVGAVPAYRRLHRHPVQPVPDLQVVQP